jgi:hypothetical protein
MRRVASPDFTVRPAAPQFEHPLAWNRYETVTGSAFSIRV